MKQTKCCFCEMGKNSRDIMYRIAKELRARKYMQKLLKMLKRGELELWR